MDGTAADVCRVCGARVSERLGNGLCAGCLVKLALSDEGEVPSLPGAGFTPGYRLLTVLTGDECRTTYLVEEEGTRVLRTLDVIRAAAAGGLTPVLFEARVEELRALHHPSIARVIGGRMTADGDFCVAAEYVPGRVLRAGDAGLAPAGLRGAVEPLCDAVAYAHDRGVIHGQLQPSSVVLLTRDGLVVPTLTGYGVCLRPGGVADDISGLGHVLAALASGAGLAHRIAPVVARATGPPERAFASVQALRDAFRAAALVK